MKVAITSLDVEKEKALMEFVEAHQLKEAPIYIKDGSSKNTYWLAGFDFIDDLLLQGLNDLGFTVKFIMAQNSTLAVLIEKKNILK